ncbi:MAG: hypothetical protein Q7U51_09445 [Methanoregula sp.]|nr:hypothetical protein [Methanoregula sp.]
MSTYAGPSVVCTLVIDSQFQNQPVRESDVPTLVYQKKGRGTEPILNLKQQRLKFKMVITWEGTNCHQPGRKQR